MKKRNWRLMLRRVLNLVLSRIVVTGASETELKNPLYYLITHSKNKADIICNTTRALQIARMPLADISHKFLKTVKMLRLFQLAVRIST